jgi:hypothetical protein
LPYKDPQKQKSYQREYKRRWRLAREHPFRKFRVYISPRYPSLRLGPGLDFVGGFLVTDKLEAQARIERHPEFMRRFFKIAMDFSGPLLEDEEVETG